MDIAGVMVKLTVGFIALFTITRLIGKTQINQLTPFDFISSLVLGEFVGAAIYEEKIHVWMVLFTIILWGLLVFGVEKITQKFRSTRGVLEGNPSIVIRNGKIDQKVLRKNHMDINQILSLLRQEGTFSIREVSYAILEPNGTISVLKYPEYDAPTNNDLDLSPAVPGLTFTLISEGKIDKPNVEAAGFDREWLEKELDEYDGWQPEEVFYAEWNKQDGFYAIK
ncbi:DUF421 domain-containing protein [Virgibacillus siamensis]|uniref:DUF421 domain-containing protein n=1 Tax=Virgibacillus siamensis TaxID=480071 RepID=UPI000984E40B|nr:DUF421 domain-containing protein [Virgibacillus siamensis]